MPTADRFREQAEACYRLGSVMYGELLDRAADDIEAGGVCAEVLAGHEHDPGPSALALRLLGSVHRLVLSRRAGALATYYPSVGGSWETEAGWQAFRQLLGDQPDAVREWLDRAPQTNEVGRSAALYGGLLHLPRDLPLRVHEIGSSGGLNLRADLFGYVDLDGRHFGPEHAELVFTGAWEGRRLEPWPDLRVVARVGSDLRPVDVSTTEGRLTVTAYVWPDQLTRIERLRAALGVAARVPAEVRAQDAVSFTASVTLAEGATTVLWHSVMWQYLPAADQAAVSATIERLGAEATTTRRFAHLAAEPTRRTPDDSPGDGWEFLVVLRQWPGGERRVLGSFAPHGVPATWE